MCRRRSDHLPSETGKFPHSRPIGHDARCVAHGIERVGVRRVRADERRIEQEVGFAKLPELLRTVRELKRKVDELKQNVEPNSTP